MKFRNLLFLYLILHSVTACNKEGSGQSFPGDCTSDRGWEESRSVTWPEDWKVYSPNLYLIDPNSDQSGTLYIRTSINIPLVKSWIVTDQAGAVVFSQENFPPNDPIYGWGGTVLGVFQDGLYHSNLIILAPDGSESSFTYAFCGLLCQPELNYINRGLNLTNARWDTQHDGNGGWDAQSVGPDFNCF